MATHQRAKHRRRGRQVPQQDQRARRALLIIGFLAVLLIVLVASIALLGRGASDEAAGAATAELRISEAAVPANAEANGRAWGPVDAPIQVIEYADYECESCGMFATQYERQFEEAFAPTGKVRFEIRNAPFHGEGARNAAEAAYCAADQNAFWPMHNSLFLNQPVTEGTGMQAFSDARLNAIASGLGLDTAAFGQCLSAGTYTAQVEQDYQATVNANVNQTPTFVINGERYPGVMGVDEFRQIFAQLVPEVTFDS